MESRMESISVSGPTEWNIHRAVEMFALVSTLFASISGTYNLLAFEIDGVRTSVGRAAHRDIYETKKSKKSQTLD